MRASSLLAFRCYFELPSINKDFTSLHFTVVVRCSQRKALTFQPSLNSWQLWIPPAKQKKLTHEQGSRLDDVEEHYKRFETYVDAKTTETLIESFLALSTRALGMVVKLKDVDALQNELKAVISSLKSCLLGSGACVAIRAAARLRQRGSVYRKTYRSYPPSRDEDGYPLDGVYEVPIAKQSSATTE